jgi:hypothetical protein
MSVLMPGYPAGHYDRHHNLPVLRSGNVAFDQRLGWNGDGSLSLVNLPVYKGDSGAPVILNQWIGPVLDVIVDHTGRLNQFRHSLSFAWSLVGMHCGGYNQKTSDVPVALGVFVKASVLKDGVSSWKKMEGLREGNFRHPRVIHSNHDLHASGHGVFNDILKAEISDPVDLDQRLWQRLGVVPSVDLMDDVGREWKFDFSDKKYLAKITCGKRTYTRTSSRRIWGQDEHLCFVRVNDENVVEALHVSFVYPETRKDVVVSGLICYNVALDGSPPDEHSLVKWTINSQIRLISS